MARPSINREQRIKQIFNALSEFQIALNRNKHETPSKFFTKFKLPSYYQDACKGSAYMRRKEDGLYVFILNKLDPIAAEILYEDGVALMKERNTKYRNLAKDEPRSMFIPAKDVAPTPLPERIEQVKKEMESPFPFTPGQITHVEEIKTIPAELKPHFMGRGSFDAKKVIGWIREETLTNPKLILELLENACHCLVGYEQHMLRTARITKDLLTIQESELNFYNIKEA